MADTNATPVAPKETKRSISLYFGDPPGPAPKNRYYHPYYQALNSFCGPIELRDAAGRNVPLLKPEVNSSNMYPASFTFRQLPPPEFFGLKTRIVEHGRLPWPTPLMTDGPLLVMFELADYFEIKESGEYQLTVWPKIYKKSPREEDLYERIDLPPASLKIKWDDRAQR